MAVPVVSINALDAQLDYIRDRVETLYLCSSRPTTFAQASSTYKLATKSTPVLSAPADSGIDGGRKMVVTQIIDGVTDATGTATYFALTDDSASELLLASELDVDKDVIAGEEFRMDSFNIENRPSES